MPRRPRKQAHVSLGDKLPKNPSGKFKGNVTKKATFNKWSRREDIEGNDEDLFEESRDRILLGEDAEGDEDWGDGDEEVFGLGLDEGSENDHSDVENDNEPLEEGNDAEDVLVSQKAKKAKKLAVSSPSTSDSESDISESWGRSKSAYYNSNAGRDGEDEDEEVNEMEVNEARRLQVRMRETMSDQDFGVDDIVHSGVIDNLIKDSVLDAALDDTPGTTTPVMPIDKVTALRRLENTSPETLALAREWDDVARDLFHVQQRLDKLELITPDASSLALSHLHHQTLLTYVATLAFYLHLRAESQTPQSQNSASVLVKRVLERLLTLKQALTKMEDLDFDASDEDEDEDEDEDGLLDLDDEEKMEMMRLFGSAYEASFSRGKKHGLDGLGMYSQDVSEKMADNQRPEKKARVKSSIPKSTRRSKSSSGEPVKKIAFDLVEPEFIPSNRTTTRWTDGDMEAYGEVTSLSKTDDADKKARKRTLRFHINKIEGSARRRDEGREKMGGDDDIPYRERNREKEARVRREVEKTRGQGGEDLDADDDPGDAIAVGKRKREEDDAEDDQEGEDGYYDLVKRMKKDRIEEKKRSYEEARLAEKMDVVEDVVGGPRSLTRAILKNKGLTPRRAKSVRNPRVKKRQRYEKAKQQVKSKRAVFKGGLAGKPYGGEEHGISKVVKSIRL